MKELGIRKIHDNLKNQLFDYIKAQYFAETEVLMQASDDLLKEKGVLYQEPYIEISKSYKVLKNGFKDSSLDLARKKIIDELIELNLGVYSTPFMHQVEAVENYYNNKDILVATGTGSGKTECFLWPMLIDLIYEARNNEQSWQQEGVRTIVLYPMNALVSDQLSRMRRILGENDGEYNSILKSNKELRIPRFGMYTGRTPYPGTDDIDKNKKLGKKIKEYYIENSAYDNLKKIGRIPSKNLIEFSDNLCKGVQMTNEMDSELFTRKEMQTICPDILITNYSMLEYMLLRPIEKNIWKKTVEWLKISDENKLLLVIDEAHMYKGAAGGEVSLLIRRLKDKLKIDDSKIKYILTSASIPEKHEDEIITFANGLVGKKVKNNNFKIISETLNEINKANLGKDEDLDFFSSMSLSNLQSEKFEFQRIEIEKYLKYNKCYEKCNDENYSKLLYYTMKNNNLINNILWTCSKEAKSFSELASQIFEEKNRVKDAEYALEMLLKLGIMAKSDIGKPVISSKVHMMFRGLKGIYACLNDEDCFKKYEAGGIKLGNITAIQNSVCPKCSSRMFELMMDRRCGTLFLKVFIDIDEDINRHCNFLWTNPSKLMKSPKEYRLWILPKGRNEFFKLNRKNKQSHKNSIKGCINIKNGLLYKDENHSGEKGYLDVLIPEEFDESEGAYTFKICPNCGRSHNRITSFVTWGNEPFANIVKKQFESQEIKDLNLKNNGKKVLLFSDSRQRAAKLARDLTIASDGDAGRQAIYLAQHYLNVSEDEEKNIGLLYYAFLKVIMDKKISFFYGEGNERLKDHIIKYRKKAERKDIKEFGKLSRTIKSIPAMYYQLLMKNFCNTYRSFNNLGLGQIVFAENGDIGDEIETYMQDLSLEISLGFNETKNVLNAILQSIMVQDLAIFEDVNSDSRNSILAYDRDNFGIRNNFIPKYIIYILDEMGIKKDKIAKIEEFFIDNSELSNEIITNKKRFIPASVIELKTENIDNWYKCDRCSGLSTYTINGHCIYCGSNKYIHVMDEENLKRYNLWRLPSIEAINGGNITSLNTAEHTAQLSYKDNCKDMWVTTEKYELSFRNIMINADDVPIDILSCTTTMEVGIDIGSLTSIGLRNIPPKRENYQQRAGRAGRSGDAVSSIVTYAENGPHDSWYFNHPEHIVTGEPSIPWIDSNNLKLVKRHLNLVIFEDFLYEKNIGLDEIFTLDFFGDSDITFEDFSYWINNGEVITKERLGQLIPMDFDLFDYEIYKNELLYKLKKLENEVFQEKFKYEKNSRSNYKFLMDVLFSHGYIPNYSFPRNIVNFWIEDADGKVIESPERSLDIALSEYAPGKAIVVNKKTYISGGLYNSFSKYNKEYRYKAAEPWLMLNEYNEKVKCCSNKNCGWFGVNSEEDICPLCNANLIEHSMIKPWGFAAREGKSVPETRDLSEMSYISTPSYSSLPTDKNMLSIGETNYIKIESRENQELVILNRGPKNKGFELCNKCGGIEPAVVNAEDRKNRKRPYRVPYVEHDMMKCNHDFSNVYLGFKFNTDMLVLEILLNDEVLDVDCNHEIWLNTALTTFSEALLLGASRELDVEFNDMKVGFRKRISGDKQFADIYIYDSLSSGAGYSMRVYSLIDSVIKSSMEILTSCNCDSSCPNCIQHFWNQIKKENLDRYIGYKFIKYIYCGEIDEKVHNIQHHYNNIMEIAKLNDKNNHICKVDNKYYITSELGTKKELVIYPAMLKESSMPNSNTKIMIKDKLCDYSLSEVWKKIINFILHG